MSGEGEAQDTDREAQEAEIMQGLPVDIAAKLVALSALGEAVERGESL